MLILKADNFRLSSSIQDLCLKVCFCSLCTFATAPLTAYTGKRLLAKLAAAGIQCTYLLLPALGSIIREVSTVLVGAHSLHSNGAVFSRAGTALVAMMAKRHSVPVVVCCETYKFSEGVQLDSFTKNELGMSIPLLLFDTASVDDFSPFLPPFLYSNSSSW